MIPQTYHEWLQCIVNECGIALSGDFIKQRLVILNNKNHQETRRLISLYGELHLKKMISWFELAEEIIAKDNQSEANI